MGDKKRSSKNSIVLGLFCDGGCWEGVQEDDTPIGVSTLLCNLFAIVVVGVVSDSVLGGGGNVVVVSGGIGIWGGIAKHYL
jgi:hypothetical protein